MVNRYYLLPINNQLLPFMKKQLFTAATLLLLSATATFAQQNPLNPVPEHLRTEQVPTIHTGANWRLKVGDSPLTAQWGQNYAYLKLEKNALVSSKTINITHGDDMGPQSSVVWSIPLSGSVKEVIFGQDGNLVVYDTAGEVLWQSDTAGRGHKFKFYSDGVLDVFDGGDHSVWRR